MFMASNSRCSGVKRLFTLNKDILLYYLKTILGKELGSGAFGRVVKAEAIGLKLDEPITTVAVKMVKSNVDATALESLIGELKIMARLGSHPNVVNLLGAYTKNIAKGQFILLN